MTDIFSICIDVIVINDVVVCCHMALLENAVNAVASQFFLVIFLPPLPVLATPAKSTIICPYKETSPIVAPLTTIVVLPLVAASLLGLVQEVVQTKRIVSLLLKLNWPSS